MPSSACQISAQEEEPATNRLYDDYIVSWTKPLMNELPPPARGGHSCIFAENKLILFGGHYFGGNSKFVYLNDTQALDLETSTWHTIKVRGQPPAPRYQHSATLIGNRMFVYGGRGENGVVFKDMHFLDLEQWCWYPVHWITESPTGRFAHAHVAVGTKLVVFGGWDGKRSFRDLWVFDTDLFTWLKPQTADRPPCARHGHSMTLLDDGRILVFGGYTVTSAQNGQPPEYQSDLWTLDTETMVWSRPRISGDYPKARFGHSVCCFGDMLFLIGGWSGTEKSMLCEGNKALKEKAQQRAREEVRNPSVYNLVINVSLEIAKWVYE